MLGGLLYAPGPGEQDMFGIATRSWELVRFMPGMASVDTRSLDANTCGPQGGGGGGAVPVQQKTR